MAETKPLPSEGDATTHPSHYARYSEYEPIYVIEAWGLDFHLGNTVKYIARAQHKGTPLEDLKKAKYYLDRAIALRERS